MRSVKPHRWQALYPLKVSIQQSLRLRGSGSQTTPSISPAECGFSDLPSYFQVRTPGILNIPERKYKFSCGQISRKISLRSGVLASSNFIKSPSSDHRDLRKLPGVHPVILQSPHRPLSASSAADVRPGNGVPPPASIVVIPSRLFLRSLYIRDSV